MPRALASDPSLQVQPQRQPHPPPCGSAFPLPLRVQCLPVIWDVKVRPRDTPSNSRDLRDLACPYYGGTTSPPGPITARSDGVPPLEEEVAVAVVGRCPAASLVKRGSGLSSSKYTLLRPPLKSERRRKGIEGSKIANWLRDGGGRRGTHLHNNPAYHSSPTPPPWRNKFV